MKRYNYIALDFDGTVVEHEFPEIGKPKDFIIEWVKKRQNEGSKILLWTCREDYDERKYLTEAVEYCKSIGIELYGVNENPDVEFGKRKIYADIYLDDRSVTIGNVYLNQV